MHCTVAFIVINLVIRITIYHAQQILTTKTFGTVYSTHFEFTLTEISIVIVFIIKNINISSWHLFAITSLTSKPTTGYIRVILLKSGNTYTVSQLCKLIFCQNFVKFRPIVKIFGTKIAERTSFSEVYSFSTSPNLNFLRT